MKQLFEKVAQDAQLLTKFGQILSDAKEDGEEATNDHLVAFAKEAGFVISIVEMQEFFQGMKEKSEAELSDQELDLVAGGKSDQGNFIIATTSVFTLGIACALASAGAHMGGGNCASVFQ